MLKNINDERNLIEHDYRIPEEKRVKEVTDVAELLYMATENIIRKTPIEVIVGFDIEPHHRLMRLEPQKGVLNFFEIKVKKEETLKLHEESNIFYLSESLRGIDGSILPFYEVDEKVNNSIELTNSNKEEWQFIISQLYLMVKGDGFNNGGKLIDKCISTLVHIPMNDKFEAAFADFLTNSVNERLRKKKDME